VPTTNARERLDSSGGDSSDALLLADCDLSTELAWLVERVARNNLPWLRSHGMAGARPRGLREGLGVARGQRGCHRSYLIEPLFSRLGQRQLRTRRRLWCFDVDSVLHVSRADLLVQLTHRLCRPGR
jgi:hypothetical protein